MKTLFLSADAQETPEIAAAIIRNGGLVAIPTETVYGLGANGLDENAVLKIFEAKGRPQDNPLILHVAEPKEMERFCHDIPESAYRLAEKFWPGPLTMVLPVKEVVPKRTTAGLNTVAVRCPDSDVTRKIIALAGVPIAAPSANISGKPSTTTAEHVRHDHDGKIDAIVDGGPCRVGVESTIVDLTEDRPRLLRPGGITPEQLIEVLGDLVIDKAVTAQIDKDAVVKAPGMKYRHYAPAEPVVIVSGSREKAAAYIHAHFTPGDRVLCFEEELPLYQDCAPLAYGGSRRKYPECRTLFRSANSGRPQHSSGLCPVPRGRRCGLCGAEPAEKGRRLPYCGRGGRDMILGITGGTGCGKTTLLRCIADCGGVIMDCDAIYHDLLKTDAAMLAAIETRFPGAVEEGGRNLKKLGALVYKDPKALEDLNRITHACVRREVEKTLSQKPKLAAIDAIALFESGLDSLCDVTVAVTAPEEDRVRRLMTRDAISEDYARSRIAAQHPESWFRERCTYTLENSGTEAQFREKCLAFLRNLCII